MKRLLLCIALLSVLISCKKSSYVAKFDKLPQERAAEQIALVSNTLTTSENGWIATLPTSVGGGYSFYLNFDKEQNVVMMGDLTDQSASTSAKSYYRVKQDMGTELVFDSYNYISMLDDPNSSVLGGAAKVGYSSDIEFTYDRINADSIILIGKKYRQLFKLVKATAAQKQSYLAGELKTSMDKLKSFFATTKNPYIEIVSGATTLKAGITINSTNSLDAGKRVSFTGVLADGVSTTSGTSKFAFKLDGMELLGTGLVYNGVTFVKVAWKDATTLAFYDNAGKEYIVKSSPTPLIAFKTLFKYNGAFNGIMITGRNLPAGITSGWNSLWAGQISLYDANNVQMESMQFRLMNATTAKLEVWFVSGTTRYLADASYTYVVNDDVITLSNYVPSVSNANWNNGWVTTAVKNYFINASFKIDWVASTDPSVTNIGGLYKVNDAASFYYGRAIKN